MVIYDGPYYAMDGDSEERVVPYISQTLRKFLIVVIDPLFMMFEF